MYSYIRLADEGIGLIGSSTLHVGDVYFRSP